MPFSGLIAYADPFHAGRHPMQTFLSCLCVVSGLPLLFGQIGATSIEALLPPALAVAWGCALTFGSGTALLGAYWPPARGLTQWSPTEAHAEALLRAVTVERIGLAMVGVPAMCYALVALLFGGWGGSIVAGLAFGFGLACRRRVRDIRRLLDRAERLLLQEGSA